MCRGGLLDARCDIQHDGRGSADDDDGNDMLDAIVFKLRGLAVEEICLRVLVLVQFQLFLVIQSNRDK